MTLPVVVSHYHSCIQLFETWLLHETIIVSLRKTSQLFHVKTWSLLSSSSSSSSSLLISLWESVSESQRDRQAEIETRAREPSRLILGQTDKDRQRLRGNRYVMIVAERRGNKNPFLTSAHFISFPFLRWESSMNCLRRRSRARATEVKKIIHVATCRCFLLQYNFFPGKRDGNNHQNMDANQANVYFS